MSALARFFSVASLALCGCVARAPVDDPVWDGIGEPRVCERVTIQARDTTVGLWRDRVLGYSRMRGLTGPIVYADIAPPDDAPHGETLRQLQLWWEDRELSDAECSLAPNMSPRAGLVCAIGVPGRTLRLSAIFEPEGRSDPELATAELLSYVLEDVICPLDERA